MKETDIAWSAGFIDGEGSIGIVQRYNSKGYGYLQVNLNAPQINKDPLTKLAQMFGGTVRKNKIIGNRRKSFVWTAHSQKVYRALVQMFPYLIVKKNEAELAIMYQRSIFSNKGKKLTAFDVAERLALFEAFQEHHQTYEYDEDGD